MTKTELINKYSNSRLILQGSLMMYVLHTINWLDGFGYYALMSLLAVQIALGVVDWFRVNILEAPTVTGVVKDELEGSLTSAINIALYSFVAYTAYITRTPDNGMVTFFCISFLASKVYTSFTTLLNR